MQYSLSRLAVLGQQRAEQQDAHVLTMLEAPINVGAVLASEKECDRRILLAANAALFHADTQELLRTLERLVPPPSRKPRRQPVTPF